MQYAMCCLALVVASVILAGLLEEPASTAAAPGGAASTPSTDPARAMWALTLTGAVDGGPLVVLLASEGGQWTRASCRPGTRGTALHTVDTDALGPAGARVAGALGVTFQPDDWSQTRRSVNARYVLDAHVEGDTIVGTYRGTFDGRDVTGAVSGTLAALTAAPATAVLRLCLERAVSTGWATHMARGVLTVGLVEGAAQGGTFHAAYPWGWHARIEALEVTLTDAGVTATMRAVVGIRPGGTDIGADPYTFELRGIRIGDTVAGRFTARCRDAAPYTGDFTGTLVPAAPEAARAAARPVAVAPAAAISVDVMAARGPVVRPWRVLTPALPFHGAWLVAGDVDGDGRAEIITARNTGQAVTAVTATNLDGATLWTWGGGGGFGLGYDVPVQTFDLDGDGRDEVFLSVQGALVVLDGRTGKEVRRHPLPEDIPVADCITFANLRGLDRPRDIIVKDRYHHIAAFTDDWHPLWSWSSGALENCHHPTLLDIDGDGKDEVLVGFDLLDHDGTHLWRLTSVLTDLAQGHGDSTRVMAAGQRPADVRIALTYCTSLGMGVMDGAGALKWEIAGSHFESVEVAPMRRDRPAPQLVAGIDKLPARHSRIWLLDAEGSLLVEFLCADSRVFRLVDWDGDGLEELLVASDGKLFDGHGVCIAELDHPGGAIIADVDGDGRSEIIRNDVDHIYIYRNAEAKKAPGRALGTPNLTLY